MEIDAIIAELRLELEHIDRAISSLERFAESSRRKRGRPPKWPVESEHPATSVVPAKRGASRSE